MSPNRRNLVVGAVVLVALAGLTWMLLQFAGAAASLFVPKGMPITILVDRADGLTEGSAIYYRGVPVGKVTGLSRAADNEHVVILAEINAQPPLPGNLRGVIKSQSALSTNNSISLETVGPPGTTPLASGAEITARYLGFSFLPEDFSDLAGDVRRQQLVLHLDETTTAVRVQMDKAGALIDAVQKLVADPKMRDDLTSAIDNIRRFSSNLETVSNNANATVSDAREVVARTGKRADDVARSVEGTLQKLGAVLDQLQSAATKINSGQGTAGLLVNDPRLYDSLADTSKELRLFIADLRRLVQQWEQEGVPLKVR